MTPTPTRRRARRALSSCLLAVLLLGPSCGGGATEFPPGSPPFHTDYDSALAAAQSQDKPAVLVFSAGWCPPCRANKAKVYPSTEVQALHDEFVWAYLDTDQAKNRPAAERFGVSGIPHIQFVDQSGDPIGKAVVGGTSPGAFAQSLARTLQQIRG